MAKDNIPAYAIVELLMRLSEIDDSIGDYRGHTIRGERVSVKTSGGTISFPQTLVMQQFQDPEQINKDELKQTSLLFKQQTKVKTI